MSSKRKSPPSKLQEGGSQGAGDGMGGLGAEDDDIINNTSPSPLLGGVANSRVEGETGYGSSPSSSAASSVGSPYAASGGDDNVEDAPAETRPEECEDLRTVPTPSNDILLSSSIANTLTTTSPPPSKRKRYPDNNEPPQINHHYLDHSLHPLLQEHHHQQLLQLSHQYHQHHQENNHHHHHSEEKQMHNSGGNATMHLNNNSTTLNHNNSVGSGGKRTMDDVLKRLTSKMNNSTIREEKRPHSPSKTQSGALDNGEASLLHLQALAAGGESFLEKERRLSEMILQLQLFREQLLTEQEQHNKIFANETQKHLELQQRIQHEHIKRQQEHLLQQQQHKIQELQVI
ncbi:box A-binding factor-like [Nilaparvata lugens]|uniref:box A-binding factor-like n=1 Tax=Nilaparvata lugens TaxID=108931 RepID=UPI00193D15B6|nr:box A-binding factor-like [Nilaparvata lugens]XP_039294827.1 box A-binding factor-like [Nilaparvata lugens]